MFTSEGTFQVVIMEACTAEPKFAQAPAFDICLHVQGKDDPSKEDWWRGEISPNYGTGNFASMTQAQITFKTLVKLGFLGGADVSRISELVGVETTATTKASKPQADGKVFYNVKYLGGSDYKPEALAATDVAQRMAQIMAMSAGGATQAATAAPVTAATAAPSNPFGVTAAATAPAPAPAAPSAPSGAPVNPFA